MKTNTLFDTNDVLHNQGYTDSGLDQDDHHSSHDPQLKLSVNEAEYDSENNGNEVSQQARKQRAETNHVLDESSNEYIDRMEIADSTNQEEHSIAIKNVMESVQKSDKELSHSQSLLPVLQNHAFDETSDSLSAMRNGSMHDEFSQNTMINNETSSIDTKRFHILNSHISKRKPERRLTSRGWFSEDPSREINFVMLLIDQLTWTNYLNFTYALKVLRDNYQYPFTDTKTLKHRYDELVNSYLQKKHKTHRTNMSEVDVKIGILLDKKRECDSKKKYKSLKVSTENYINDDKHNNNEIGDLAAYVLNSSSSSHSSFKGNHTGTVRNSEHIEPERHDSLNFEKGPSSDERGQNKKRKYNVSSSVSDIVNVSQADESNITNNTEIKDRLQNLENKVDVLANEIRSLRSLLEKTATHLFSQGQ